MSFCVWQSPQGAYENTIFSKDRASSGCFATRLKEEISKSPTFKVTTFSSGQIVTLFFSGSTLVKNYPFSLVIALVRFWSLPQLINGIKFLMVISQLIPVHDGFRRKPSRKPAGLTALVYWRRLIGR